MAQSDVDCCNSALQKLGEPSIIALDSNTLQGRQILIAYESNRKSELRKHRWNFAIKRAILAPDATAPAFDYAYAFTVPADCLRVLMPTDVDLDWVVEGRKILSNSSNVLRLRYIADVANAAEWDSIFYDMLAISLAIDLCERLTNSVGKKAALEQDYRDANAEARKNNAYEQLPQDAPDDSFIVAHRRGGVSSRWINFSVQG